MHSYTYEPVYFDLMWGMVYLEIETGRYYRTGDKKYINKYWW